MTGSEKEGCYVCSGKNHYKNKLLLQEEVDKRYPNTFVIMGEYVRARSPLLVKRIPCGHEYTISPDNLLRGKGCPKCGIRQSHYMDIVERYLEDRKIVYVKEKRFENCKSVRALPFDYYIPSLNVCIEVDGQFHYPGNGFHPDSTTEYDGVVYRDNIKNQYCLDNNIKLIRLPYYKESDFSNILDSELHVNTEITH